MFQAAEHQETYKWDTKITSITPFSDLSSQDQSLFNTSTAPSDVTLYALTTESTIFHPQGGGQPSDIGNFYLSQQGGDSSSSPLFTVLSARVSTSHPGQVLHFGHFHTTSPPDLNTTILQVIDQETRHLFSRLHTAGHVLGTCTRTLLEHQVPNFDELKASHFPGSAACEFQGSIDGKHKVEIQRVVDELVAKDAEVRIEWWRKREFRERQLERLLPTDEVWKSIGVSVDADGKEIDGEGNENDDEETRIRVVNIVGSEVYPCGGTHVPGTKGCGKVVVKKISRTKGNSRISYSVD